MRLYTREGVDFPANPDNIVCSKVPTDDRLTNMNQYIYEKEDIEKEMCVNGM